MFFACAGGRQSLAAVRDVFIRWLHSARTVVSGVWQCGYNAFPLTKTGFELVFGMNIRFLGNKVCYGLVKEATVAYG